MLKTNLADSLVSIQSDEQFDQIAKHCWQYQYENNAIYRQFLKNTGRDRSDQWTFLPVELFKGHRVVTGSTHETVFKSSGTTDANRAHHYIQDLALYNQISQHHFESIYGPLSELTVLALLPSYIENGESSLVHMVNHFINEAKPDSAFVLNERHSLKNRLNDLSKNHSPTILFGVSYALLDFAEEQQVAFPELTIMETGGMKGRRKEMTRKELHEHINVGFPESKIHSEYGMTELLSQGYQQNGRDFQLPTWVKAFTTDISDPFQILQPGQRGLLAFIDLANYHSCSFLQTKDIGIVNQDGSIIVEGRLDQSDVRGCNLLYT